jgi:hypothetical protein
MAKCYEMLGVLQVWAETEEEARKKLWREPQQPEMLFETLREVAEGSGPQSVQEILDAHRPD